MYMKFNPMKLGLAGGIITAICMALTLLGAIYGYFQSCANLLVEVYGPFGVSINFMGVMLGAIYGFINGFILTLIFALIYNKLIR
jgi:hypothetical protein